MFSARLLVDTLGAVVLGALLAGLGWVIATPLLTAVHHGLGIERLMRMEPLELVRYQASVAVACSLPVAVAWVAALVDRFVACVEPSPGRLAGYLLLPFLAGAGGFAKNVAWLSLALSDTRALAGLQPTVSLASFELGWTPIRWTLGWGMLLCVLVGLFARRRAAAARAVAS